jgi:hypothetical protein
VKWFDFDQNNSGGRYKGPAAHVYVQAQDAEIACVIAQRHGVYFDGIDAGDDCSCCGDRWSRPWGDGEAEEPSSEYSKGYEDFGRDSAIRAGLRALYVYADGTTREVQP